MAVVPMRKDKRRRASQRSKAARVGSKVSKKQKASKARTKREKKTGAWNVGSAEKKSPTPSEEPAVRRPIAADQARERVVYLVRRAAEKMAEGAVKLAIEGQFAQLKYLYELAGIYPAAETTAPNAAEEPLIRRIVAKAEQAAAGSSE